MEWVASTLHTTSERGLYSITTALAHTSAASSRLNWRPRRFKLTRPLRRKTKSGFCACAITFQTQSASSAGCRLLLLEMYSGISRCVFQYHKQKKYTAQHNTLISYNTVLHVSFHTNHRQALLITSLRENFVHFSMHFFKFRFGHCLLEYMLAFKLLYWLLSSQPQHIQEFKALVTIICV